nr:hypothetical protein CFP56_23977 [Quercus suber]
MHRVPGPLRIAFVILGATECAALLWDGISCSMPLVRDRVAGRGITGASHKRTYPPHTRRARQRCKGAGGTSHRSSCHNDYLPIVTWVRFLLGARFTFGVDDNLRGTQNPAQYSATHNTSPFVSSYDFLPSPMAVPSLETRLPIERLEAIIALPRSAWENSEKMYQQVLAFTTMPRGTASNGAQTVGAAGPSRDPDDERFLTLEDLSHCSIGGQDRAGRIEHGNELVLKQAICQAVRLRWVVEDDIERVASRLQEHGLDMLYGIGTHRN